MLAVEEVVAGLLVFGGEDPAADFRENAYLCVLVLEGEIFVVPVHSLVREIVVHRVRVDMACCALICAPVEEIRIEIGIPDKVCGDGLPGLADFYLALCVQHGG